MKTRVAIDLQKMSELVCPPGGGAVSAAYLGFSDSGERVDALPYEPVKLLPPFMNGNNRADRCYTPLGSGVPSVSCQRLGEGRPQTAGKGNRMDFV